MVPFRSSQTLSTMLIYCYYAHVVVAVLGAGVSIFGITISDEELMMAQTTPRVAFFLLVTGIYALIYLVLFLITAIAHCIWTNRSASNTIALGATGQTYTPNWSVGWFFIPLANIIMPYRVATEIVAASTPGYEGTAWKSLTAPGFLGWWWGCYILSGMISNASTRMVLSDDPGLSKFGEYLELASVATIIVSALLAAKYVRLVCDLQHNRSK